jgi:protein-tyrosine phosphatase
VRSDCLDRLSRAGWDALEAHGVRTIVDLRNEDEREPDLEPRPAGLTTMHVPLDDVADSEFWDRCHADELDGTPLYYRPFIDRKPERCAVRRLGPSRTRSRDGCSSTASGAATAPAS